MSIISPTAKVHFYRLWRLIFVLGLAQIVLSQNSARIQLVGVGTTSPLAVYSRWFEAFEKTRPDLHFSYIPSGSEIGIEMVTSGTSDFGGTDAPMTGAQLTKARVLQFPTVIGAIVPIYNLPGVAEPLRFSSKALAGIYLGSITKWDDAAISGPNRQLQLPSSNIVVIHSAYGRGSTYIWSDYLSKVSAEWRTRVGRGISVAWPVGKEADGNGNLARTVKETPNSIGYVELVYAMQNNLPYGRVQNAAGNFISADSSSITAAAVTAASARSSDFRLSLTNLAGDRSYPISSFIWILVSENMGPTKQEAMKDFLRWMMNEGQAYAEPAGFARLPRAIVEPVLREIEKIP
jgi:phosphate transport system substrate-binding protein